MHPKRRHEVSGATLRVGKYIPASATIHNETNARRTHRYVRRRNTHNHCIMLDKIPRAKKKKKTNKQRPNRIGKSWNRNSWQHSTKQARQQKVEKGKLTKAKEKATGSAGTAASKDTRLESVQYQVNCTQE